MNIRERVLAALRHQEPDRPPLEIGGNILTRLHWIVERAFQLALRVGTAAKLRFLSCGATA